MSTNSHHQSEAPAPEKTLPARQNPEPEGASAKAESDPGLPGGGRGRVDVTGVIRSPVTVDPDITEGRPGYEESGNSEFVPPEILQKNLEESEKPAKSD